MKPVKKPSASKIRIQNKMDTIIEYDTVIALLANPPSLDPRPNFFNLCELRTHFARGLRNSHVPNWLSTDGLGQ